MESSTARHTRGKNAPIYRPKNGPFDKSRFVAQKPPKADIKKLHYTQDRETGGPFAFQFDGRVAFGIGYWDQNATDATHPDGRFVWAKSQGDVPQHIRKFCVKFLLTQARHPENDDDEYRAASNTFQMLQDYCAFQKENIMDVLRDTYRKKVNERNVDDFFRGRSVIMGSLDEDLSYTDKNGEERESQITFSTVIWADERQEQGDPIVFNDFRCNVWELNPETGEHVVTEQNVPAFSALTPNRKGTFLIKAKTATYYNGAVNADLGLSQVYVYPREDNFGIGAESMDLS